MQSSKRDFIISKIDATNQKAKLLDCWWVCVFWQTPKCIGNNVEVTCSYFEEYMDMKAFVSLKIQEKTKLNLPYYICTMDDCFYSDDFLNNLD